MKIYTCPKTTCSEKIPRDYFKGGELVYIPNGKYTQKRYDLETAQGLIKTQLSKIRKIWKFEPRIVDLSEYIGKKEELFKQLENVTTVFLEGGNTYEIARLKKASGFSDWLNTQKNNPEMVYIGYSGSVVSLTKDLYGIDNYDDPKADTFGIGTEDMEGLGLIGETMLLQHKNCQKLEEEIGKTKGELVEETIRLREFRGMATIAVPDSVMLEWDLMTDKKKIIKYNQTPDGRRELAFDML
ncbi:MAG: Type 1 glutamine amidotransferase-like domain-containing protein [Firmicutes bacterium]|nr:Type 1 glutamine amidotransferase-like domain-containing protein [Bacillota bacterium]MCL2771316.1 Type 1 glutamine amidotransferase-like domain-containing protein [Bacillota bacterium]